MGVKDSFATEHDFLTCFLEAIYELEKGIKNCKTLRGYKR